jgi:DNA mismatch repair ATPase MutS
MNLDDPDLDSLTSSVRGMYSYLNRSGFSSEATELARYFNDTNAWIGEITKVLRKSKGIAYVVVGSNSNRGRRINIPLAIQEIARTNGLSSRVYMRYRIKNYYMQYPTKGSRISYETVLKLELAG